MVLETAPKLSSEVVMAQFLRRLVSQNKQRHVETVDGKKLDLDLTYLTETIICMGLPATGFERNYRNPIEAIAKFLEASHAGKYKIFNLCNERQYDISNFGGACATFPFDDHGAPPLMLVAAFCASAKSWLLGGMDHVVAIHCLAGKGRTGLMSTCLLLHLGWQKTPAEAISFYDARRTKDGKGLTNASQRRYVHYYFRWLNNDGCEDLERPRMLSSVRLLGVPSKRPRLTLRFVEHAVKPDKNGQAPSHSVAIDVAPGAPSGAFRELECNFALRSDVKLELTDEGAPGSFDGQKPRVLCRVWFNTRLQPAESTFVLRKEKMNSDIDLVERGVLPEGFTIVLTFVEGEPGAIPPRRPSKEEVAVEILYKAASTRESEAAEAMEAAAAEEEVEDKSEEDEAATQAVEDEPAPAEAAVVVEVT